jgi:hypothetical protein
LISICGVAPFIRGAGMSVHIPPDNTVPVFSMPEVPYGFIAKTRTFYGALALGTTGAASVTAQLDDHGNLLSGRVLLVGGNTTPSIPAKQLLIEGDVFDILVTPPGSHFALSVLFRMTRSHPSLGYTSPIGVWDAYFDSTAVTPAKIWQVDWGPSMRPLNSYVGQVKNVI